MTQPKKRENENHLAWTIFYLLHISCIKKGRIFFHGVKDLDHIINFLESHFTSSCVGLWELLQGVRMLRLKFLKIKILDFQKVM